MDFKSFYNSLDSQEKQQLAKRAETSTDYLYQIANGHRSAGVSIIERLMEADNRITFQMMRRNRKEIA